MSDEVSSIAAAKSAVAALVAKFKLNEREYLSNQYNETQARTDFVTPLLEAFGWDVHNQKGYSQSLREVIEEATVEVEQGEEKLSKKPDYELRLERQRKLFVEAKKPSVNIINDRRAAFQARRYGFSAGMPISVLTNFHQLVIYDCTTAPRQEDAATHSRFLFVGYEEFEARFDELWPLLSREAVYAGEFDRRFEIGVQKHGSDQFDSLFLDQVRKWRELLAKDIHATSTHLNSEELTYAVQLFLSRIVFLRICEDREIEAYETLKGIGNAGAFDALKKQLEHADAFYDSGLFRLADDANLNVQISDETLSAIVGELYYPQSPYTFAVVETEVLGEIYEQFLGDVIVIENGQVQIENKPEVRASGGVVPTPRFIVDRIVSDTLGPLLAGKSPDELRGMTVMDPCCGSGIFLLSAFEQLQDHYLSWYVGDGVAKHQGQTILEGTGNQWKLTLDEKRRILTEHLRGVDIDANATEVAQFSLHLKLIEDQTKADLEAFVTERKEKALPALDDVIQCGNSLVSTQDWQAATGVAMSNALIEKVNPLSWPDSFQAEMQSGGFDVIVANPPYIRIQNMAAYSPEEVRFYQHQNSPYTTAQQDNFDKYALFIERCLSLVKPSGRIGMIVPHKFMNTQAGESLRRLLTAPPSLERIVHFGAKQVFGKGISNYTCILILSSEQSEIVEVEQLGQVGLESWK
ncbi:MAG: Eco57I restriction-modification methylase domain-containing protein, partial [Limisphaerales bacterium]